MINWHMILVDGLIYALVGSAYLVILLAIDARMFLNKGDYPDDVLAAVPPRTPEETRKGTLYSIPFFLWSFAYPVFSTYNFTQQAAQAVPFWALFVHAFLIFMSFWLFDLVVLDWLMFCTITPKFIVIPGTEGFAGYKDYGMHFRGHLTKGILYLVIAGAFVAGAVALLW